MLKKKIFIIIFALGVAAGALYYGVERWHKVYTDKDNISYVAMVDDKNFLIYQDGKWLKKFIKGVNMGVGEPGAFPGELAITKREYLRWFKYIGDMNADVIRVYTTLKPDFYNALYEYNQSAKKPLYIMQGVWVNEDDIAKYKDAHNDAIKEAFKKDERDLVDIIHGKCTLPERKGQANGVYTSDVSRYVMAWILGIEWDPEFVAGTNANHPDKTGFSGKYLFTENASPFEAFLCEAGDDVIKYETQKYSMQRPVSFTN